MNVTIIGNGFSGTLVAARLMRQRHRPVRVRLVGSNHRLGAGVAYATREPRHLLNVPASQMSALVEAPDHFAEWLHARTGSPPNTFAARTDFQVYIEDLLHEAIHNLGQVESELELVTSEVTSLDGEADIVVLATGHLAETNFGCGSSPYGQNAWPTHGVRRIVVVGSGLTAVDGILSAAERYPDATITALSRTGRLPETFEFVTAWTGTVKSQDLRGIVRELHEAAKSGVSWHAIFTSLRMHWDDLWARLSASDRARFRRHLRDRFDGIRHRLPPPQAERLKTLSQLQLVRGVVTRAHPVAGNRFDIEYDGGRLEADLLLDASGFRTDWSSSKSTLLRRLFAQGILQPGLDGIGIHATENLEIISRDGVIPKMYAIGPMHQGRLLETTAVAELRQQAATIADQIVG